MTSLRTRLFHVYARARRPMTLGVRAAVEAADGRVLMVRHTYIGGWHMPGGGIETGEPAIEALRRELLEEAGIILLSVPAVFAAYSNHQSFKNDHILFYRVPWASWDQTRATQAGEIAETDWVDPRQPRDGVTRGSLLRFEELYGGAAPSPYWGVRT